MPFIIVLRVFKVQALVSPICVLMLPAKCFFFLFSSIEQILN